MSSPLLHLLLISLFGWTLSNYDAYPKLDYLVYVAIVARNGEETARFTYPKFGNNTLLADLGGGQLTEKGVHQAYMNGNLLRARYQKWLMAKHGYFRKRDITVLSSNCDRCKTSMTAFMAGFLPTPENDTTLNFPWQPVVFTVDPAEEEQSSSTDTCPKFHRQYIREASKLACSQTYQNWLAIDEPMFVRLEKYIGASLATLQDQTQFIENLPALYSSQANAPEWIWHEMHSNMYKYIEAHMDLFHETDFMMKIRGGRLIAKIIKEMEAIRDNVPNSPKILVYSGNIYNLFATYHLVNMAYRLPKFSHYTDTIAMELYKKPRKKEMEVHFWISRHGAPRRSRWEMVFHGCGRPCPISQFISLLKNYTYTTVFEWDTMCNGEDGDE